MVVITEITDPDVRTVSGSWAIGADGSWVFIPNPQNAVRRMSIREGDKVDVVRSLVREAYGEEYIGCELHLAYQWPDWMDIEENFGGKTRPVPITTDETMGVFLAMRYELDDLNLFVSKESVDWGLTATETSASSTYGLPDRGKTLLYCNEAPSPNYKNPMWHKLMDDEAVLRWMQSTQPQVGQVGESSSNVNQIPLGANVERAFVIQSSGSEDNNIENGDEVEDSNLVEADLLANLGMPAINLSGETYGSDNEFDDNAGEETIKECNFFGPSATYMSGPLGEHLDLEVSLHEALEDMCLNFASFNRDAAPTLDDQGEEGRIGMELALRDVQYEGDELFVGRVFKNKQDCNVKLAIHALNRRFHFRCDRSSKKLLTLTCFAESCPWRVYIVKLEDSDNYQIRRATLEHTCTVEERSNYHRAATTCVIGSLMKGKYEGNTRGPRAIDLQRLLLTDHSVRISYWKAWKSREIAIEGAKGSAANSFSLLPAYIHVLREANPGSIVDLKTEVDAKDIYRFKYLFLAFAASVQGFAYMRRVIVIDGAHLKGKYGGCLLTASCQDANFQVFPLAFGVEDSENDDAWEWFFRVLSTVVPDDASLTFVSDRHSSIYTGLRRVYPKARHGACVVHLQRNIATAYKKKHLLFHVSRAARAFRICEFHTYFNEVIRLDPVCALYLESVGFCHWTRAYFLGERYNVMTSNVAESLNAVLKEARELPIISLIEFIRTTLMSWFAMRREAARSETSALPPKMREVVHQNFEKSVIFSVRRIDRYDYEIRGEGSTVYHVKLLERTCSYRAFDLLQYPCPSLKI